MHPRPGRAALRYILEIAQRERFWSEIIDNHWLCGVTSRTQNELNLTNRMQGKPFARISNRKKHTLYLPKRWTFWSTKRELSSYIQPELRRSWKRGRKRIRGRSAIDLLKIIINTPTVWILREGNSITAIFTVVWSSHVIRRKTGYMIRKYINWFFFSFGKWCADQWNLP